MLKRIKHKILQKLELFKEDGYFLELVGRSDVIECNNNTCLVHWYNQCKDNESMLCSDTLNLSSEAYLYKADVDLKVELKNDAISENHNTKTKQSASFNTSIEKDTSCNVTYNKTSAKVVGINATKYNLKKDKLSFNSLLISKFSNECDHVDLDLPEKANTEVSFYIYSKKYLSFLSCINIDKDNKSVKNFDMELFYIIFTNGYVDDTIKNVIKKLIDDSMNYDSQDKQDFIVILLYAYNYCKKHALPFTKDLLHKLKQNIFLVKKHEVYKIQYVQETDIDKYLLDIKKFENFTDEMLCLNFYYVTYISKSKTDKIILLSFMHRICRNMQNIESEHLHFFLRNVFMKHSVLYATLNTFQLYKAIIDFFNKKVATYNNTAATKSVLRFYLCLIHNIKHKSTLKAIIEYINTHIEERDSNKDLIWKLSISGIDNTNTYISDFDTNKESFCYVKLSVEHLQNVACVANGELGITLSILDTYINIYNIIKTDHLFQLINTYYKPLCSTFEALQAEIKKHSAEINMAMCFFNRNVDTINKLILSLQRFVVACDDTTKKCTKKETRKKPIESLFCKFADVIYDIEKELVSVFGRDKIILMKSRSFKLIDRT